MVQQTTTEIQSARSNAVRTGLTHRAFFADVVSKLRGRLPKQFAAFHEKSNSQLLKVYFDNERVHFEVALHTQQRLTEIGLHFEDGPSSTLAFLAFFDRHIVELKHELGPELELERWTQSWGRLFELTPMTTLTERLAERTSRRLADMICVLQPLVEEADVAPERSLHVSEPFDPAKRWRQRQRRR